MFVMIYENPEKLVLVNTDQVTHVEPVDSAEYSSPLWNKNHKNCIWLKDKFLIYTCESLYDLEEKFNKGKK